MSAERLDRRVARIRQALRDALLALIEEQGYEAITIENITDRANVGRATFYLHYKDKEDLLLEELNTIASQHMMELSQTPLSAWMGALTGGAVGTPPLRLVFEHIYDNAGLYKLLVLSPNAGLTEDHLTTRGRRDLD